MRARLATLSLLVVSFSLDLHAQDQLWGVTGSQSGEYYGDRVSALGWVNLDQWPDVIVGASGYASFRGRVQVLNGSDGAIIHSLEGSQAGEHFGYAIDDLSNINGDGAPDFIVGAFGHDSDRGRVLVYSGRDRALLFETRGSQPGSRLGYSVASAGDVDGDLITDFLVGAFGLGEVYLFSGRTRTILSRFGSSDFVPWHYGWAVSAAGDVNADGRLDIMIGAPRCDGGFTKAGTVFVYDALNGTLVGAASGMCNYDFFGMSLAAAGDVNLDGYDDYLVGAPLAFRAGYHDAGFARLVSGRDHNALFEKQGSQTWEAVGASVAGNKDIDRDGYLDLVIGSPYAGSGVGRIHAYSGRDFTQIGWAEIVGISPQATEFGYSCDIAGDVYGNHRYEVVVGAPRLAKYAGFTGMYVMRPIKR